MISSKLDTLLRLAPTTTNLCDGLHNYVQRNDKCNSLFGMLSIDMVTGTPHRTWASENESHTFFEIWKICEFSKIKNKTKNIGIFKNTKSKKYHEISEIDFWTVLFLKFFALNRTRWGSYRYPLHALSSSKEGPWTLLSIALLGARIGHRRAHYPVAQICQKIVCHNGNRLLK